MTVVPNDEDELVAQRTVVGYRMCIDYSKLNKTTRNEKLLSLVFQRSSKVAPRRWKLGDNATGNKLVR